MTKRHSAGTLSAALLLLLFLAVGAAALLLGARVWKRADAAMTERLDRQIPLSYLAGKARQSDSLSVEAFADGTAALALGGEWDGVRYVTRLYCRDGRLCELFSPADVLLTPADGTEVTPLAALALSEQDGLVTASLTDADGETTRLLLAPRRGEGARS